MPEDLVQLLLNHPLTYIVVMGILIIFIINALRKGKLKPEQQPDWGVKYYGMRVQKHLKMREKALSVKPKKTFLYRDIHRIGKIILMETIPVEDETIYSFTYRKLGFFNAIKSAFGFGRFRIFLDDENIKSIFDHDHKEVHYMINKDILMRERGGILIMSKKAHAKFLNDINSDADYLNTKGFVSDFPRRLSNLSPAHAQHTDSMELDNELADKTEQKKRFQWGKGG